MASPDTASSSRACGGCSNATSRIRRLSPCGNGSMRMFPPRGGRRHGWGRGRERKDRERDGDGGGAGQEDAAAERDAAQAAGTRRGPAAERTDRKSGVEGKSGQVRVELGGGRII